MEIKLSVGYVIKPTYNPSIGAIQDQHGHLKTNFQVGLQVGVASLLMTRSGLTGRPNRAIVRHSRIFGLGGVVLVRHGPLTPQLLFKVIVEIIVRNGHAHKAHLSKACQRGELVHLRSHWQNELGFRVEVCLASVAKGKVFVWCEKFGEPQQFYNSESVRITLGYLYSL